MLLSFLCRFRRSAGSLIASFATCGWLFAAGTAQVQPLAPPANPSQMSTSLTVSGSGFAVQTLASGGKAFANRAYHWQAVPSLFEGWKFTQVSGGSPATVQVRADRDTDVYVAAAAAPQGASGFWQPVPSLAIIYDDRNRTTLHLYRAHLRAGVSLTVPQNGWTGTLVLAPNLAAEPTVPSEQPIRSLPPGVVIDYSPAATQRYVGSPALALLPDGSYIAAHDFFGPHDNAAMRVFRSEDRGRTWKTIADLTGQYWSSLFFYERNLYLIGVSKEFGNIVIRRSEDGGHTWTTPRDSASGLLRSDGLYHGAPTPVPVTDGRLWRAFEKQPADLKSRHFEAFLLSAPLGANLLRAESWSRTTPLSWVPEITHGNWLEGNAIQAPGGGVVDLLRIDAGGGEKVALLTLSPDGQTLGWNPARDHPLFPGGKVKFTVRFDPVTRRYWSLVNKKSHPAANRNVLALKRLFFPHRTSRESRFNTQTGSLTATI